MSPIFAPIVKNGLFECVHAPSGERFRYRAVDGPEARWKMLRRLGLPQASISDVAAAMIEPPIRRYPDGVRAEDA